MELQVNLLGPNFDGCFAVKIGEDVYLVSKHEWHYEIVLGDVTDIVKIKVHRENFPNDGYVELKDAHKIDCSRSNYFGEQIRVHTTDFPVYNVVGQWDCENYLYAYSDSGTEKVKMENITFTYNPFTKPGAYASGFKVLLTPEANKANVFTNGDFYKILLDFIEKSFKDGTPVNFTPCVMVLDDIIDNGLSGVEYKK